MRSPGGSYPCAGSAPARSEVRVRDRAAVRAMGTAKVKPFKVPPNLAQPSLPKSSCNSGLTSHDRYRLASSGNFFGFPNRLGAKSVQTQAKQKPPHLQEDSQ